MRFFIDTEFIERGREFPIQLISIGIVCENGKEFYGVSADYDPKTANEWVKENVLAHVNSIPEALDLMVSVPILAQAIFAFVDVNCGGEKLEFWGYYADYDWVVLCQMFGTMMDLPKGWPMYCRDLKQWCDDLGNPKLPEQDSKEHHALADARWNKQVYEFLAECAECEEGQEKR